MSVQRQRLLRLLAEPASTSAVLLVAPPGYGKTVLLQQYAEDERLVYINLSTVSTREALVRELISMLSPRTIRSLGTLLGQQANAGFDAILTTWILVRLRTIETTIVLDDLQHIAGDESSMKLLSSLVEGTRSHIRWIFSSRQMPVLPVGTWIAHSITTLPLTERDLSFNVGEARELADSVKVAIADDDLAQIVRHNAGWPIGIRLSIEAWNRFRSTQPLLTETRNVLFSYLQTELWKNLSRIQRELILACALLPKIVPELLEEAGYANAAKLLGTLERVIPFVTKNPDGSYSIHELFRDFAIDASRKRPGFLQRVLANVGGALTRHDRFVEALALAVQSGQPSEILGVLGVGGMTMLETGARQAVADAIAVLPSAERDHAIVRALQGAIAHSNGSGTNADGLYRSAYAALDLPQPLRFEVGKRVASIALNRNDGGEAAAVLTELMATSTLTLDQRLEAESVLAAAYAIAGKTQQSLGVIKQLDEQLDRVGAETRAKVNDRISYALFYSGDLARARERALDVVSLAQEVGFDRIAAAAFSVLYAIAAGADPDASHLAYYARETAVSGERAGDRGIQLHGLHAELVTSAESGDVAATARLITTLDALGHASTYRGNFDVRMARAVLEAATGDANRATSMLVAMNAEALPNDERALLTAMLALFDILAGKREAAIEKISPALLTEASSDFLSQRNLTVAQTFRGLALWLVDRRVQAERALTVSQEALGERDRILVNAVREIIAFPHPIPSLANLEPACARVERAGLGSYAMLFRKLSEVDKADVAITPAELQMLRAFYEFGGRTADVAAALNKSPYTIRNQVRSTIAKLGCSGRNDAIRYARQRGWF